MSDRDAKLEAFLAPTIWKSWPRQKIAGDASARRYFRLTQNKQSVIIMDADPAGGETIDAFVTIAHLLKSMGLCPPDILAIDPETGFLALTDLGQTDVATWLEQAPADAQTLYRAAADTIIHLSKSSPPDGLTCMTPQHGAEMISILGSHYTKSDVSELSNAMQRTLAEHAPLTATLALRDFHAENLIWRPAHSGTDRIGLLDFQDAFIAPAGYDLASLLRDARRDVPDELARDMIAYVGTKTGQGRDFHTQVACLGVQRNLRIMGVFARLSRTQGKARYLAFLPRVWRHILADLENPALANLREVVRDTVPQPTPDILAGLAP